VAERLALKRCLPGGRFSRVVDPMHFEAQAASYARARPPYPPALWNTVRELGLLKPGQHALDLGAGTGQATGPLLAAGLRVTAVEPGPQLAAWLQAAYPAATVVVARAEDAELEQCFDLAVAATSIHWMDLDVVLPKLQGLLTPGGKFLVWRNVFGDPDAATPFRERVAEIVRARRAPPRPGPDAEDPAATRGELTRSGLFTADDTFVFRWSIELDDRHVHRLFSTFSDWTADEVDRAAAAVRELGGRVVEHYQSWLIVLTPRAASWR
jgi:SAM-dependent methyltransferase